MDFLSDIPNRHTRARLRSQVRPARHTGVTARYIQCTQAPICQTKYFVLVEEEPLRSNSRRYEPRIAQQKKSHFLK
jgi:hypothetical protein